MGVGGHSAVERIKSMKNLKDLIENQTHDLPPCRVVPQSTALSCTPPPPLFSVANTKMSQVEEYRRLDVKSGLPRGSTRGNNFPVDYRNKEGNFIVLPHIFCLA